MEIVVSVVDVQPGNNLIRHTHHGEEAVYVLEGATLATRWKRGAISYGSSNNQHSRRAPRWFQGGRRQNPEDVDGPYRR
ncbi:hypothetical protein [Bradyrhizobium elkanii]|uniref:hypothetical protein n=1 Tax=Bradyrhizobium elkanii TaxID=29448 RepID=UPI003BAD196F